MKLDEKTKSDIVSAIQEMDKVITVLNSDHKVLVGYVNTRQNTDFWVRTSIRSFFADTEARVYQLRRLCLSLHALNLVEYSPEEIVCLQDKTLRIDRGNVITTAAKTRTQDGFLFSFKMFARSINANSPIDTEREPEWILFCEAIKIRDRLMHPKTSSDLQVTDNEINTITKVIAWVDKKTGEIAERARQELKVRGVLDHF